MEYLGNLKGKESRYNHNKVVIYQNNVVGYYDEKKSCERKAVI